MTPSEAERLSMGLFECALRDASGREAGDRAEALAWLASRQAAPYYDLLGIEQSGFLMRCGWLNWASDLLNGPFTPIPYAHLACIMDTHHYLLSLQGDTA